LADIESVAPTPATVLLLGETGTGKELLASALHDLSPRRGRAFVKVNCAAISPSLIESELFGHEKGAFTGALQRRVGRFELAQGGTLFLDEIGELPLDAQAKLLRVVQEREIERIGGTKTIPVDVRIICATNRNLEADVVEKRFRADLFYRLNVFPIHVPPLRERRDDIPLLVNAFVRTLAKPLGHAPNGVDETALDLLCSYNWCRATSANCTTCSSVPRSSRAVASFGPRICPTSTCLRTLATVPPKAHSSRVSTRSRGR